MSEQFQYLFTPIDLGPLRVRNRIVSSPHGTCLADDEGLPTEAQVHYYAEKAKGGVGMMVMGASYVHPTGIGIPHCNRVYDDRSIPGLKKIAGAVHSHGAKILGQLGHVGAQFVSETNELPLWAPSPIPFPYVAEIAHQMDIEEIEAYIEGTVHAALNYQAGGFDGVEIYPAHAYLLGQFLSPFTNRRTDAYGGSLEGRLRLLIEVIERVRQALGPGMAIGVRISGDELTDGGLTLKDMQEIAPILEATGQIDYLHVSQSGMTHLYTQVPDLHTPLGAYVYLAAGIKESVRGLPVVAVTRIIDPLQAEQILADGYADLVTMNRATIADPELPHKAREGRLEEIRPCISCNQGCIERVLKGYPIRCTQNPAAGREKELGIGTLKPAPQKKRVLVVGGGPAGLEAARVAAERGHRVTLCEARGELGGQVAVAARAPRREELGGIVRWRARQLERLGVEVHLNHEVSPEEVLAGGYQAVIVATGAVPDLPLLPGIDQENVVEVQAVLGGDATLGERVLVVDGGEGYWRCCATAEMLADRGAQVQVVAPGHFIGSQINEFDLEHLYERLGSKGVVLSPHRLLRAVRGKTVVLWDAYFQREEALEGIDTVVLAPGYRADDALYRALKGRAKELHAVGDCLTPRRAKDAIREGHLAGRAV